MKPNPLIKLVALLLVPCLLAEPAAAVSRFYVSRVIPDSLMRNGECAFALQALAAPLNTIAKGSPTVDEFREAAALENLPPAGPADNSLATAVREREGIKAGLPIGKKTAIDRLRDRVNRLYEKAKREAPGLSPEEFAALLHYSRVSVPPRIRAQLPLFMTGEFRFSTPSLPELTHFLKEAQSKEVIWVKPINSSPENVVRAIDRLLEDFGFQREVHYEKFYLRKLARELGYSLQLVRKVWKLDLSPSVEFVLALSRLLKMRGLIAEFQLESAA